MTPLVARITLHVQRTCALLLRLSSLDSLESIVTHFSMSRQGPKLPYPLFSALPRESIRVLLMSGIHRHVLIGTSFSLLFYRSGMPSGRRARGACARPFSLLVNIFQAAPVAAPILIPWLGARVWPSLQGSDGRPVAGRPALLSSFATHCTRTKKRIEREEMKELSEEMSTQGR